MWTLTALTVDPTLEPLYGLDAATVTRFAQESAALIRIGAPASREPLPLTCALT